MVELSVVGASRQSKYPNKIFGTGISFLKMMLNLVQLRMVYGNVEFLASIHVKYRTSWSTSKKSLSSLECRKLLGDSTTIAKLCSPSEGRTFIG